MTWWMWVGLILQGMATGLILWLIWRERVRLKREFMHVLGTPLETPPHDGNVPQPGTTFLPDDAETARREASLKKASRERAGLIR